MNITEFGKRHGLSRSTLLYYDRIGLLSPAGRSAAGYREYSTVEQNRLKRICTYRRAGIALGEIGRILDAPAGRVSDALRQRLEELDEEMDALRQQQRLIAKLLQNSDVPAVSTMDKETWVSLLTASGFSDDDMNRWHVEFEASSPEKHEQFLRFLGIPEDEVTDIRRWSHASETTS